MLGLLPQLRLAGAPRNDGSMPDVPVRLRPIEETDLELLSRFDTDPAASQPFGWTGFPDPRRPPAPLGERRVHRW
jgi:hypothetical protein